METFLITFTVMILAVAGMALGVMFKRAPIKGTCGGLNNIEGVECGACSTPCEKKRQALGLPPEDPSANPGS